MPDRRAAGIARKFEKREGFSPLQTARLPQKGWDFTAALRLRGNVAVCAPVGILRAEEADHGTGNRNRPAPLHHVQLRHPNQLHGSANPHRSANRRGFGEDKPKPDTEYKRKADQQFVFHG
jgi:hypothetical protein